MHSNKIFHFPLRVKIEQFRLIPLCVYRSVRINYRPNKILLKMGKGQSKWQICINQQSMLHTAQFPATSVKHSHHRGNIIMSVFSICRVNRDNIRGALMLAVATTR